MVVADGGGRAAQRLKPPDDVGAELDVLAHDRARLVGGRPRLQHAIGDRELADVVQPAAEPAAQGDALRQPELDRDPPGQLATSSQWCSGDASRTVTASARPRASWNTSGSAAASSSTVSDVASRVPSRPPRLAAYSAAVGGVEQRLVRLARVPDRGAARRGDGQLGAAGQLDRGLRVLRRMSSARASSVSVSGISGSSTANSSPP